MKHDVIGSAKSLVAKWRGVVRRAGHWCVSHPKSDIGIRHFCLVCHAMIHAAATIAAPLRRG
jgi:hypothetical protein